jgi:hypothetical protein
MRVGDLRADDVGASGLGSGIAGNGGTAVWVLIASFASARAITKATTSSTAAPAAIHNQRGDFGPPGGGEAMPCECSSSDAGTSCCQYAGSRRVVFVSSVVGAQGDVVPP